MHPLIINESAHTYYQHPQHYVTKGYDTVRSASPYIQPTPSSSQPRRASMATTLRQRSSTKSVRDRRKSSGTLSSHHHHHQQNQHQKPRKYIGDYYVGKTLGKGASGRVKLGIHKHTGEQVAIKIISKAHLAANPAIEKAVRREIAIMKLIRHPNVMALVDVIDDANSSDINLILEHVQGGELFEYLVSKGRLTDSEARRHFQQIILGLDFCHHHLICHRDLKPENLLLDHKNNIKIADFGMASLQPSGSMLETSCGSPHYASPEIVAGTPYNGSASDIWSCGVILYALLTGHLPFDDENIRQLLKKVKAGKYAMPDDISRSAQDLIRRILVVDPLKRLTMEQIMAHPWFCESEPVNLTKLPIPPTANEIGRPVSGASDIDDRILETIKFLWGETQDETIVRALVSKEHNMQKVVYVLLQQHSERYWQKDHDDEDLRDSDRHYQTIGYRSERNRRCMSMVDGSVKKSTAARPSVPWMPEPVLCAPSTQSNSSTASSSGTMAANASIRRYSATTSSRADRSYPEFMLSPPLPPMPLMTMDHHAKSQIKKSETFYSRFIKNVLTSRRQSKGSPDSSSFDPDVSTKTASAASDTSGHHYSTMKSTLAGTLRRKNPFGKPVHQDTNSGDDKAACDPLKSMRRKSSISRNKIEAKTQDDIFLATSSDIIIDSSNKSTGTCRLNNGKQSSKTLNTKRLSIRVPNAFRNEKGTHRFGFTLNGTRRQRKELDMSLFHTQNQTSSISSKNNEAQYSDLTPPPALSDGSTLSNTSISTSNTRDNHHQHGTSNNTGNSTSNHSSTNDVHSSASSSSASSSSYSPVTPTTTHQQAYQFKTALRSSPGKGEFLQSPPPPPPQASSSCSTSSAAGGSPRESQVSLQSMVDRRGSNINTMNRPITPSLLSNNSTITTASGSYIYSPSQAMESPGSTSSIKAEAGENKSSWLSNLFFFKQPKVCSVVIPETDVGTILCTLHRLINQTVEAKLYEKDDKQGIKRYKAEIKTTHPGKARQVKCRLEIMPSNIDSSSRRVQFTQQQGDGAVMTSVVHHLQQLLDQEYPTASSAITAGF